MSGMVKFKCDPSKLSESFQKLAIVSYRSLSAVLKDQGRLIAHELMQRTPPFSGKMLNRMLAVRGAAQAIANAGDNYGPFQSTMMLDPEVEQLSAKAVGERRVELDIRKVIYGVRGPSVEPQAPEVFKGQDRRLTHSRAAITDWGVYQKCQGQDAIRIFATKSGEVYGIDRARFNPAATEQDLERTHQAHRGKRGRVTTAGSRDRVVGRWRWIDAVITKADTLAAYIEKKKKMVGQAKGGWAAAFMRLGGKMSSRGWIGRHASAGSCDVSTGSGGAVAITFENKSAWASSGDPDRIIPKALEGRQIAVERQMQYILNKRWGNIQKEAA